MELTGKKTLVTGAFRGIGKAIADRFLAAGAEVWGLDITEPDDLKDRMEHAAGKLHWVCADLSKINEVEPVIENIIKESGGLDVLVNNAGITKDNLSFRMSIEEWQKVLDINLSAAFIIAWGGK